MKALTICSRRTATISVAAPDNATTDGHRDATVSVNLANSPRLQIEVESGSDCRSLLGRSFSFIQTGEVRIPVCPTPGTFHGVRIPWSSEKQCKHRFVAGVRISNPSVVDDVYIHLADEEHRTVITCNCDLQG